MTAFFTFCIGVSLSTLAVYVCIHWQGMILNFTKPYLQRFIPAPARKPVYDCLVCMSSVWTTAIWLLVYGWPQWHLLWAILIVAGMNTLLSITLEKLTDFGS
jgi:hypothetical protein